MLLFSLASLFFHRSTQLISHAYSLRLREAEHIKHYGYFAHRLAWNNVHEKRIAQESYHLSQQAFVAVSSADR